MAKHALTQCKELIYNQELIWYGSSENYTVVLRAQMSP